jgi:hypothetical protein
MMFTNLLVGDLYMWKVQKPASHVPWTMDKINLQRAGCASNSWHFWSAIWPPMASAERQVWWVKIRVPETDYRFSCLLQPIATPWVYIAFGPIPTHQSFEEMCGSRQSAKVTCFCADPEESWSRGLHWKSWCCGAGFIQSLTIGPSLFEVLRWYGNMMMI